MLFASVSCDLSRSSRTFRRCTSKETKVPFSALSPFSLLSHPESELKFPSSITFDTRRPNLAIDTRLRNDTGSINARNYLQYPAGEISGVSWKKKIRGSLIPYQSAYAFCDGPSPPFFSFYPRLLHPVSVRAKLIVRLSRDPRRCVYHRHACGSDIVVVSSRIAAAEMRRLA